MEKLARLAAAAQRITVLTGAGVSAESGIPTFRDAQTGLWSKYDPVMLASIEGFTADPQLVWQWYDERRSSMRAVEPNNGHKALAEWQSEWERRGRSFTLLTQNIDDLHSRAGSRDVIELHGNICCARPLEGRMDEVLRLKDGPLERLPPFDSQDRLLRPHVVWFGEMLDPHILQRAAEASASCDLFLCVGTSSGVYPAAGLAHVALNAGATVIEINPARTDFSDYASHKLRSPSGEALPLLLAEVLRLLG